MSCSQAVQARLTPAQWQPACLVKDAKGHTPLDVALRYRRMETARYFIEQAPWGPQHVSSLLAALNAAGDRALPLYAVLVGRCSLTPEQWDKVPTPCPGLGDALPAVLRSSPAEAPRLVQHMTEDERHHLRTLALLLGVAQQRGQLPQLPPGINAGLLAYCAALFATAPPEQQRAWQQPRRRRAWLPRLRTLGLLVGASVAVVAAGALLGHGMKRSAAKQGRRVARP